LAKLSRTRVAIISRRLVELNFLHRYATAELSIFNECVPPAVEALGFGPWKVIDTVFRLVVVVLIP
jgi:hypothetical protein